MRNIWKLKNSLRGQLTLWFGGLSLAILLGVGAYVGRIATSELAQFGGPPCMSVPSRQPR